MSVGYVYCGCCGDDCMDGPLCLSCDEAGCEADENDCQVPPDEADAEGQEVTSDE